MLFLFNCIPFFAQNIKHNNAVNSFISNFNNIDYEGIYQSFSPKMQNARSKEHYFNFFSKVKKHSGSIILLELINYQENTQNKSRAEYIAAFENENLTIKITINADGKIIGLYILRDKIYI